MPTKMMDLNEFMDKGYLQEANRQFFHALGLALFVVADDKTGKALGMGVYDAREDPEGWAYSDGVMERAKADLVRHEQKVRKVSRRQRLGYWIQPAPKNTSGDSK